MDDERLEEVRKAMDEIGLAEELFDVYVLLCRLGISKAATVAKELGTSRPDIYRRLDRLSEEGFVSRVMGRPARYTAKPPEELFRRIEGRLEKQAARVDRVRDRFIDDLNALHGGDKVRPAGNTIRMIEGASRIRQKTDEWITQARTSLDLVSTGPHGLVPLESEDGSTTWLRLDQRISDGVRLRVMVSEEAADAVGGLPARLQQRIRSVATQRGLRFLVRDGQHLLAVVASTRTGDHEDHDVAMITDASGMLESHAALVDELWRSGKPVVQAGTAAAIGRR